MLRLSTGLRNALVRNNSYPAAMLAGTTISFGDGDGADSADTINDSGEGFVDAGFEVGQYISVLGSTSNNIVGVKLLAVAAGILTVAAGTLTDEVAGDAVIVGAGGAGGGFAEIFRNGTLDIYSGTQPATADAVETGTKLLSISVGSSTFTPGSPTNGINFVDGDAVGEVKKSTDEIWSGVGLADGSAGWGRFYANDKTTGASTSGIRFDGSVATSGGQFTVSVTNVVTGATSVVNAAKITQPSS